jgi:type II secretory pathway component PulF
MEQISVSTGMLLFPICPVLIPFSIYRDFQVSILFSSMAVLLQSGMTLTECIKALIPNSSAWLRWHLNRILLSLNNTPSEYIDAFSKGLLGASLLAKLSSSIRHTSHFDKLVIKLGTTEGEQIRKQIEKVTKTINAMLLVLLGSVIMYLYVGQFSISNDLTDALSSRGGR